jgi:hypothetical protein
MKAYVNTFEIIQAALNAYDHDVKGGKFPSESESYSESLLAGRRVAKRAEDNEEFVSLLPDPPKTPAALF